MGRSIASGGTSTAGLSAKNSVLLASAAVLPAYAYSGGVITETGFGALVLDGTTATAGTRVLVKNETGGSAPYNGIYLVTAVGDAGSSFVLTRAGDLAAPGDFLGAVVAVESGTANQGNSYECVTAVTTVGVDPVTFIQSSGPIVAGTGLSKSGNTLSVSQVSRVISGASDSPTSADLFGILHVTFAGTCAITLPDLSGNLIAGRDLEIEIVAEGAQTVLSIGVAAGVTVDSYALTRVLPKGMWGVRLRTRTGKDWYTGLAWTPDAVRLATSGNTLWLDERRQGLGAGTSSNGGLSAWFDVSGGNAPTLSLKAAGALQCPILDTMVGGVVAPRATTGGLWMQDTVPAASAFVSGAGFHFFAVVQMTAAPTLNATPSLNHCFLVTTSGPFMCEAYLNAASDYRIRVGAYDGGWKSVAPAATLALNTPYVIEAWITGGNLNMRINGVAQTAVAVGTLLALAGTGMRFGVNSNASAATDGAMPFAALWSAALSATQQQIVRDFIAQKYGLTA